MQKLENLVRRHFTAILLLLLLGGFATVLAELLITNHVGGTQLVAVVATVVGALAVLAGFFVKGTLRHVVAILLLVLTVSGLMGMRQHAEAASEEAAMPAALTLAADYQPIAAQSAAVARTSQQESTPREGGEAAPPPLAPLSLSGLALMGAVVLLAKQDA